MTRTLLTLLTLGGIASAAPRTGGVAFSVRKGEPAHVTVELALTPAEQQHGLMDRRSLAGGAGMLFVFPELAMHQFWMHDTYIPLDMIFLDADKRVVFVEENAKPLTDSRRGPTDPVQFVVEVPGGWARSHGIGKGVLATFSGVPDGAH